MFPHSKCFQPLMLLLPSLLLLNLNSPVWGQVQGYPLQPGTPPMPSVPGMALDSAAPLTSSPPTTPPVQVPSVIPECPPAPAACTSEPFRFLGKSGVVFEAFPRTLLWEPPMANLREPRFMLLPNTLSNYTTDQTLETSIGTTLGLFRWGNENGSRQVQLDLYAVAISRISNYDYLVGTDYRAGLPITLASGPWHAKFAYDHTSTHLGDETLVRTGRKPIDYIKDELSVGLGRWLFRDSLRLYGQASWAFFIDVPGDPSPFSFDLGFEWYHRKVTGFRGQPYAAGNLEFNGVNDYNPNLSLQAGWQWRDPNRRFAMSRVFLQYYTGYATYGQFFDRRESWIGFGIAMDY